MANQHRRDDDGSDRMPLDRQGSTSGRSREAERNRGARDRDGSDSYGGTQYDQDAGGWNEGYRPGTDFDERSGRQSRNIDNPGLAPGSYQNDPGHRGARGGYWARDDRSERPGDHRSGGRDDRGFFDKASDEVSSWFGDQDAERRREADQHRGKGPKNYKRSDQRIEEDLNDRLSDDGYLDATDIEVSVAEGEVTLSGTVSARMAKRRAEDCADSVGGVGHVQNNLRVKSNEMAGRDGSSSDSLGATHKRTPSAGN